MKASPLVAIIILNWNNASDTLACLDSASKLDYPSFDIIVVDNGSTDDSTKRIRVAYPAIRLLTLRTNSGYAAGNNIGIQDALLTTAKYLLILNNDTQVASDMLTELVRVMEDNPRIGMVGPKMYCTDPMDTLFATGSFVDWPKGIIQNRSMFQPEKDVAEVAEPEPVDFITGCGVLVRRALIEKIGGLNPIYYLNYEDAEWGIRAWRNNFEVWFVPQAIMWHKVSATLGQVSPANTYYMTRNALLFFWQNSPFHLRWLAILHIISRTLWTISAWTLKAQYRTKKYHRLRQANFLALRDFFLGRFGQMGSDVVEVCYPKQ